MTLKGSPETHLARLGHRPGAASAGRSPSDDGSGSSHGPDSGGRSRADAGAGSGHGATSGGRSASDGGSRSGETLGSGAISGSGGGPGIAAVSRPAVEPIVPATAHAFSNLDELEAYYAGAPGRYMYQRYGSPNADALGAAVAGLEGAAEGLAVASGQAATLCALLALTPSGGAIVLPPGLYGGTTGLVHRRLTAFGFDLREWDGQPATLAPPAGATVVVESITNPLMEVPDLGAIASACRAAGAQLVVDNTMATPLLCRPLLLAQPADLVVHSATKLLNGHGDVSAGIVAGPAPATDRAREIAVDMGMNLAPFEAWLCLRGLRTLHLRLSRAVGNATLLAAWLRDQPGVLRVHHPSLRPLPACLEGPGPMLAFELEGGKAAVGRLVEQLASIPFVPTFGDLSTTLSIPALTSHRGLTPEARRAAGITDGLVRLSIGTEDVEDLQRELQSALQGISS